VTLEGTLVGGKLLDFHLPSGMVLELVSSPPRDVIGRRIQLRGRLVEGEAIYDPDPKTPDFTVAARSGPRPDGAPVDRRSRYHYVMLAPTAIVAVWDGDRWAPYEEGDWNVPQQTRWHVSDE
jgi:hypothetical protein